MAGKVSLRHQQLDNRLRDDLDGLEVVRRGLCLADKLDISAS